MSNLFVLLMAANFLFPLRLPPLITAGFGEFRILRFHAGVDLSTLGKTGYPVRAAADGHVVRIRASYWGYGKVIYFQDDSTGHIFVYAHLSRFRPELERYVYEIQKKQKKYSVNDFPKDTFYFKKGQILAWTGKTGTRTPHLHFEIRNKENEPVNPFFLYHLPDTTFPAVDSLRVISCKDGEIYSQSVARNGAILHAKKPFIIEVIAYDPVARENVTNPYKIELWSGKELVYAVEFDTFNYSYQRAAGVFYSFEGPRGGKKWIRLCNPLDFTNPFQLKAPRCYKKFGKYRLVVKDFYGHTTSLSFEIKKGIDAPDTAGYQIKTPTVRLKFRPDGVYAIGKFELKKGKVVRKFNNGVRKLDGKNEIILVSGKDTLKIQKATLSVDGDTVKVGPYTIGEIDKGLLFNSNVYYLHFKGKDYIFPEVLPINRRMMLARNSAPKVGIFSYDERHNKWDFVGKDTSYVISFGAFKMLKDTRPPTAKFVTISRKKIEIKLHDNLSGIKSDSIVFYLDGKWEPVHYYFDLKKLVYWPPFKIKRGRHTYRLIISDNLGNVKDLRGTIVIK